MDNIAKPHREICALCHEVSRVGFWVPNEIWKAAIHPHYQNSIVCLRCFTRLADEKSVPWDKEIKFYPVSWISQSRCIIKAPSNRGCKKICPVCDGEGLVDKKRNIPTTQEEFRGIGNAMSLGCFELEDE